MPVPVMVAICAIFISAFLLLRRLFSSETHPNTPQETPAPLTSIKASTSVRVPPIRTASQYEKLYGYVHMHAVLHNNRQSAIRSCVLGETLQLIREPQNPYDKNAIRVLRPNGLDVGHVAKENAAEIAPRMDRGETFIARVNWINPPHDDFQHHGLKVRISFLKDRKVKNQQADL
jgi:hypothetical protein